MIGKHKTVRPGDVIEVYTKHKMHLFKSYGASIKCVVLEEEKFDRQSFFGVAFNRRVLITVPVKSGEGGFYFARLNENTGDWVFIG